MSIDKWYEENKDFVEKFYKELENNLNNYTRPIDYKERAHRVITGKRNITGYMSNEHNTRGKHHE